MRPRLKLLAVTWLAAAVAIGAAALAFDATHLPFILASLGGSAVNQPRPMAEYLKKADTVLAIGTSLTVSPFNPNMPAGKQVIHARVAQLHVVQSGIDARAAGAIGPLPMSTVSFNSTARAGSWAVTATHWMASTRALGAS